MDIDSAGHLRTVDEVKETLDLAFIKESNLNNVTQILYIEPGVNTDKNKLKLLELDEYLLETIEKGESLSFRGNKNDHAVLCTKDKTYDMKEAETSNSCLLVPNLKFSPQTQIQSEERVLENHNVAGIFHMYYEVRECKPKLEKLLTMLDPSSFKGVEYESGIDPDTLYNWEKLRSQVQASEEELKQALHDYLIVEIDGYIRLISFECEARSLTYMLDLFDANCWEVDEVDKELMYDALKELILKPVFDTLFHKYTEPSNMSKEDGTPLYRYEVEKCCKILAKVLLAASPVTEYDQFIESWSIGTPEKMRPKEEYLSGIALVLLNDSTMKKEVVSFPEENLSKSINERFNQLFKVKNKWTVQEITPYVSKVTTGKLDVNGLLTKYARCSVVNGIKYYSSKHGK